MVEMAVPMNFIVSSCRETTSLKKGGGVVIISLTHIHTQPFYGSLDFVRDKTLSGTTRVSRYQKVHFTIFWIFWSKIMITQADAPTIWMDCHPIQTNWCPHLPSPPFLHRMPFLTQPCQFILAWDRHQIC